MKKDFMTPNQKITLNNYLLLTNNDLRLSETRELIKKLESTIKHIALYDFMVAVKSKKLIIKNDKKYTLDEKLNIIEL